MMPPITFANPLWLAALVLVPATALFFAWAARQREKALAGLGELRRWCSASAPPSTGVAAAGARPCGWLPLRA